MAYFDLLFDLTHFWFTFCIQSCSWSDVDRLVIYFCGRNETRGFQFTGIYLRLPDKALEVPKLNQQKQKILQMNDL